MVDAFSFRAEGLEQPCTVIAFAGSEAISQPHEFEIHFVLPVGQSFDADAAVGRRGWLVIHRADGSPRRTYAGAVASLELMHELTGEALYRAVLVPEFWKLGLSQHNRVFTRRSIPEILETLFATTSTSLQLRLERAYPARDHVCQYHESDLAFVSRWMEREGIYYHPDETADPQPGSTRDVLVLADDCPEIPDHRSMTVLTFDGTGGGDGSGVEGLWSLRRSTSATPARVSVRDYDDRRPLQPVSAERAVHEQGDGVVGRFGDVVREDVASTVARLRSEELAAPRVKFHGRGRVFDLVPGKVFAVSGHPRSEFAEALMTLELRHRGLALALHPAARKLLGLPDDALDGYVVEITAMPAKVPFRPPAVTPVPRVYGVETGTVEGPETSRYAQIDSDGRYLVRLHFDEQKNAPEVCSTRMRMLQPHAGSPEGFHFPLRRGTEVMVVFLGGDPDRPVIAGAVPNPATTSPVIGANHAQNVIRTGGLNELVMDDTKDEQFFHVRTPKEDTYVWGGKKHPAGGHNLEIHTNGSRQDYVGRDRDKQVDGDETQSIKGQQSVTVEKDQSVTTQQNKEELVIGTTESLYIGNVQEMFVGNKQEINIGELDSLTIASANEVFVGKKTELSVSGTTAITVGPAVEITVATKGEVMVGDTAGVRLGNDAAVTVGNKTELAMGNTTETYLGNKIELAVGTVSETFVGAKTEVNVAAASDITMGIKNEVFIGGKIEINAALALAIFAGTALEVTMGPKIEMQTIHISKDGKHISIVPSDLEISMNGTEIDEADLKLMS